MLRVVHILSSVNTSAGGPPQAAKGLTSAAADLGVASTIVTTTDRKTAVVEFDERVRVLACPRLFDDALGLGLSVPLPPVIAREIGAADVLHLHELWNLPHALGGVFAALRGRPYVVSPHGALFPWCLGQRRIIKKLAWMAYERRIMQRARVLHVLTEMERSTVRLEMGTSPVPLQVIPNGVDVSWIRSQNLRLPPELADQLSPYVLFVGRLHEKKGLDLLLQSFASMGRESPETKLVIAGPDPESVWPRLAAMAAELNISERVLYLGLIDEITKVRLLTNAELFALPSISEGLSMAVLEALACGVPVVVSIESGMDVVAERGAGCVVERSSRAFRNAMVDILAHETLRSSMSERALALAKDEYDAQRIARRMIEMYRRLADGSVNAGNGRDLRAEGSSRV